MGETPPGLHFPSAERWQLPLPASHRPPIHGAGGRAARWLPAGAGTEASRRRRWAIHRLDGGCRGIAPHSGMLSAQSRDKKSPAENIFSLPSFDEESSNPLPRPTFNILLLFFPTPVFCGPYTNAVVGAVWQRCRQERARASPALPPEPRGGAGRLALEANGDAPAPPLKNRCVDLESVAKHRRRGKSARWEPAEKGAKQGEERLSASDSHALVNHGVCRVEISYKKNYH